MKFAAAKSPGNLFVADADKRKLSLTMENLRLIYPAAFSDDDELSKQLVHMEMPGGRELGVILVSDKCMCCKCGGALALRSDRPSHLTIYSEALGTVTGTHYHKTCKYPGCKVVQYYGYTTSGSKLGATYDSDWSDLTYFVSSQETAFETSFLKKMDADLLIGQLSYRQRQIFTITTMVTTTSRSSTLNLMQVKRGSRVQVDLMIVIRLQLVLVCSSHHLHVIHVTGSYIHM